MSATSIRVEIDLGDEETRERFCQLLDFARHGRVLLGYDELPDDELDPDDPDDEGLVARYDDTDRSHEPGYPLAYALGLCQWYDFFGLDAPPGGLRVSLSYDQPILLDKALAASPYPARRVTSR
jgi:hypothetical protein